VSSSMIMNCVPCHGLGLGAIVAATNQFEFLVAPTLPTGDIP
jgi:hypothetical protein